MSAVSVNTYAYSVTYVADNILKSLKDIIVLSELNPDEFWKGWESNSRAIRTWLESKHLTKVMLEIYHPKTNELITRWDIDVVYEWAANDDGTFYTDTDLLRYHIRKAGIAPSSAKYRVFLRTNPGEPYVQGWGDAPMLSTTGFVRQSMGSTVNHNGLAANTSYWRKVG
jgi:hypothetical protein